MPLQKSRKLRIAQSTNCLRPLVGLRLQQRLDDGGGVVAGSSQVSFIHFGYGLQGETSSI